MKPLDYVIDATEEAQRLRGWIANAYAQIEFFLGDLIVQSLSMQEYDGIGKVIRHGSPDRIKRVRRLFERHGFYTEFEAEIRNILDSFEVHHRTRNLLAHGFCIIYHTPEREIGFEFRKWHRVEGKANAQLRQTFRLIDLENEKNQMVELSRRSLELFRVIHGRLGLVEE